MTLIEIVVVGRDYFRVFGLNTFTDPSAPIEILINSTTRPIMGGGAVVGDIDLDGFNETIFGACNGTIYFINITDSGGDSLSYSIEWQSDFGHSPGYKESMVIYDLDADLENELFVGDNFGQIMSIGKSDSPTVTIDSPGPGSTKTIQEVLVLWTAIDDFQMHHFDISINSTFFARTGGSQTGITLPLAEGINYITINGFDITGRNDSDSTDVTINLDSPEVTSLTT